MTAGDWVITATATAVIHEKTPLSNPTRLVSFFEISVDAVGQHIFDEEGMRFVADFEHVLRVDVAETLEGRLDVVERLAEIPLSRENDGFHSVVRVRNRFGLGHR